ncbi:RRP12 protein, partial [Polypterus senegalus]
MISCTILALTRLVYEFKDFMEISVVEQLLENVCLLLSSKTREVVKAALSFIKVILFVLDIKILTSHVSVLMEGLGSIKDDIRWNLRTKLKNIFTKLMRKFGIEDILAESEPEDEEDVKHARVSKKQSRHKGQAWLKEGEGDEPLNFLDPKVSQRVLATNPDVKKTPKASHGFKVASDGRLIISNDDDDEEEKSEDLSKKINKQEQFSKIHFFEGRQGSRVGFTAYSSRRLRSYPRPDTINVKKGKGDIKKKGKHDPYAYVPLKKTQLNRRMHSGTVVALELQSGSPLPSEIKESTQGVSITESPDIYTPKAQTFDLFNLVISFKRIEIFLEPVTDAWEMIKYLLRWRTPVFSLLCCFTLNVIFLTLNEVAWFSFSVLCISTPAVLGYLQECGRGSLPEQQLQRRKHYTVERQDLKTVRLTRQEALLEVKGILRQLEDILSRACFSAVSVYRVLYWEDHSISFL